MNDIVCVWIGDKYSEDYVINLYNGVKRHTTQPFRFNVITEHLDIANKIPCRVIPRPNWGMTLSDPKKAWWYKMYQFAPECAFGKNVLYLDLDIIIINNIDKFLTQNPKKFFILQDFNRQFIPNFQVSNSSIMKYRPKKFYSIWKVFNERMDHHINAFRGDQDFMTWYFQQGNNQLLKQWWSREWAMSWKWELDRGGKKNNGTDRQSFYQPDELFVIPSECSIIVCHGDPKPPELHKKIKRHWDKY